MRKAKPVIEGEVRKGAGLPSLIVYDIDYVNIRCYSKLNKLNKK